MAAELKLIHPTKTIRLVQSRDKLLSSEPLPDDFKDQTVALLRASGVEVILGHRVTGVAEQTIPSKRPLYIITFSDGSQSLASHVIWAISNAVPAATYLPGTAIDQEGLIKINAK